MHGYNKQYAQKNILCTIGGFSFYYYYYFFFFAHLSINVNYWSHYVVCFKIVFVCVCFNFFYLTQLCTLAFLSSFSSLNRHMHIHTLIDSIRRILFRDVRFSAFTNYCKLSVRKPTEIQRRKKVCKTAEKVAMEVYVSLSVFVHNPQV